MQDLISEFIEETIEGVTKIDSDLLHLEQEPNNQELLGNVFRLMHTIKGTCGFIGLPRLERIAHAVENMLDAFRGGKLEITAERMTLLFICVDRVRFLATEIAKLGKDPEGDDNDLVSSIEKEMSNLGLIPQTVQAAEVESHNNPDVAPAQSPANNDKPPEYVRIQMNMLEDIVNMVSELVLVRNQMLQGVRDVSGLFDHAQIPLQKLDRLVSELQDGVMKTRMQPISNAWTKLPRIVRDLSAELNKQISLEMSGEDTELDRQILELIKDPMVHMIRNACDHGIELPQERLAAGKTERGAIRLRAHHEGGFVVVSLSDNGRGLDYKKIGEKAIERGLLDREKLDRLNPQQILQYIMKPGFSTAEHVTSVSGRGVGMDVVRENIEKIGGAISVETTPGRGTEFKIQIPLTLAIISALIVEMEGALYAMPQASVRELVQVGGTGGARIEQASGKPVLRLRDKLLPLLNAPTLFGTLESDRSPHCIIVIDTNGGSFGIAVDAVRDTEEIVIKPTSALLRSVRMFFGNAILGDGRVVMVFDPAAVAREFDVIFAPTETEAVEETFKADTDDSVQFLVFQAGVGALKALPLPLISRLQTFDPQSVTLSGGKRVVRYNDALIPLFLMSEDQVLSDSKPFISLIISDDRSKTSIGLITDRVVDVMEGVARLNTSTAREGVIGSTTLNDEIVDLIDIAYFTSQVELNWFSALDHQQSSYALRPDIGNADVKPIAQNLVPANGRDPLPSRVPRVLIVDDSAFFRNMLRPILVAAGYEVVSVEGPTRAIALHDHGEHFDAILSDIEMPDMDGYAFVEVMRQDSAWKDLPFIAITSHNTAEDIAFGFKKGFDAYIGKLDKNALFSSLANLLSKDRRKVSSETLNEDLPTDHAIENTKVEYMP